MEKRLLIAAMALLTAVLSLSAQSEQGTFSVYPRIGINLSNLSNDELYLSVDDYDSYSSKQKTGLMAGAEVEYQILPILSITGGAMYSIQGCKYNDMQSDKNPSLKIKGYKQTLHYINVPLLLNLYVARGLALKAGVQCGFLVHQHLKYNEVDGHEQQEVNVTTKLYKNFDVSIPVGFSYEYQNIVLDLRYNIGATNIIKKEILDSKNQVVAITLGYKFEL